MVYLDDLMDKYKVLANFETYKVNIYKLKKISIYREKLLIKFINMEKNY